jgi:hypothetical protein
MTTTTPGVARLMRQLHFRARECWLVLQRREQFK